MIPLVGPVVAQRLVRSHAVAPLDAAGYLAPELGGRRAHVGGEPPAHDAAAAPVDHAGQVHMSPPDGHVNHVDAPHLVGEARRLELARDANRAVCRVHQGRPRRRSRSEQAGPVEDNRARL